ncbi:MAG TPA: N-acetylmuramoyl-L-alanine amidase-like domain-containing protein [Elusimicrobiota bacterium]|jgi:hypothetical protein|nr:N-acetylmuramoyl-L-alanine amidase-like domain-containing protein [Elusimicrobiota bacterium]
MTKTFLLAALLAAPGRAAEPVRFLKMTDAEIASALKEIHARNPLLEDRIARVSEAFLGTPYVLGPLGEGPSGEFDRDPLVDLHAVDCTTYVEEVMALSLEPHLAKATKLLQKIRYRNGKISYETRNHFPEADWVPNNVQAGFLKDITRRVAGDKAKSAGKIIRKRAWYEAKKLEDLKGFDAEPAAKKEKRLERWRALGARYKDQTVALDYLPIESLPKLADKIPSGTVASLVREDKEGVPVLISHQLLIVDKGGAKFVRHAGTKDGGVEDVPLLAFFYPYFNSKWKLLGLNLLEVTEPR